MYKSNVLMISILLLLCTGCATQLTSYQPNEQLNKGNGWLVLNVVSPNPEVSFEVSDTDSQYRTPSFKKGTTFEVMQLPVGNYYISGVIDHGAKWRFNDPEAESTFSFTIFPDSATLLGDITLEGNAVSLRPYISSVNKADDYLAESFIPLNNVYLTTTQELDQALLWEMTRKRFGAGYPGTGAINVNFDSRSL